MRLAQLYCCVGGWSSRIGALGIAVPFVLPLFIPCFHYNPASRKKQGIIRENPVTVAATGFLMAEKEGFEPSRPFRGLHDFQSCALDQLGDFSIVVERVLFKRTVIIIQGRPPKVNPFFKKIPHGRRGPAYPSRGPAGPPPGRSWAGAAGTRPRPGAPSPLRTARRVPAPTRDAAPASGSRRRDGTGPRRGWRDP